MSKMTLEILAERIDNAIRKIDEGFHGVHKRQDKTNGNVLKNTEWRLKNEKPIKIMQKIVYGTVAFVLTSVGVAILSLVIK
jgi:hypothetical protein